MSYFNKKYSKEKLQQRSFILSSFTRLNIILDNSVYEFADMLMKKEWKPELGDLNKVDQDIFNRYKSFINNESRRY